MKKILLLAALVSTLAFTASAVPFTLLNGLLYTNATQVITVSGTGTNQNYSTNQIGVVLGASTNTYSLPTSVSAASSSSYFFGGTTVGTNTWPSSCINMGGGYPNTLYGPANNLYLQHSGNLVATNATSTAIVFRYAGTVDGSLWVSNYLVQTFTVAVNTTTPGVIATNTTTGALPILALQAIENPGAAAFTNIVVKGNAKAGL